MPVVINFPPSSLRRNKYFVKRLCERSIQVKHRRIFHMFPVSRLFSIFLQTNESGRSVEGNSEHVSCHHFWRIVPQRLPPIVFTGFLTNCVCQALNRAYIVSNVRNFIWQLMRNLHVLNIRSWQSAFIAHLRESITRVQHGRVVEPRNKEAHSPLVTGSGEPLALPHKSATHSPHCTEVASMASLLCLLSHAYMQVPPDRIWSSGALLVRLLHF